MGWTPPLPIWTNLSNADTWAFSMALPSAQFLWPQWLLFQPVKYVEMLFPLDHSLLAPVGAPGCGKPPPIQTLIFLIFIHLLIILQPPLSCTIPAFRRLIFLFVSISFLFWSSAHDGFRNPPPRPSQQIIIIMIQTKAAWPHAWLTRNTCMVGEDS